MASINPEKALVSQSGALQHMKKLLAKTEGTNFVPRHVRSAMPATANAVETILKGIRAAMADVHQEARPFLTAWQAGMGLKDGAVFKPMLLTHVRPRHQHIEAEGTIVSVQLHDEFVQLHRVVEIVVRDVLFYHVGSIISEQEIAADLQMLVKAGRLALGEMVDPATGLKVPVYKFRLGITSVSRTYHSGSLRLG